MDVIRVKNAALFRGMTEEEIQEALVNLPTEEKIYGAGETILCAGSVTSSMGLVLSGAVTVESCDVWGTRTILNIVDEGEYFAETYALTDHEPMMVDVVAQKDCRILFLNIRQIRGLSGRAGPWALKLLLNLLSITAGKNIHLSQRSFHTAPKSVRERVLAYLNTVSLNRHSREFDIPFDRQQLADYLNVERSALSKELGKMQRDGLIRTRKNHFVLVSKDT